MALRLPELCFWSAKSRKKLFEMHTCDRPGAQLWFRHKWRKLVTASLLLHCIVGYSCLRFWNGSFSAAFQVLDWSFLVLHFYGNVCNWIPCDLTTNGLILVFFVGKWLLSLTSYLYGLKFARIAQLLFFFDDINFFRCLVWGAFWSVLQKCLYFWAIGFCNIDW